MIKHVRGTREDACGTSLTGYWRTTYEQITERFGAPSFGPNDRKGDKVTCEWILKFDGHVVTIYDWKEPKTPFGEYEWHVGSEVPFNVIGRFLPGSVAA